jgi:phosphoglycolate phosphatase
MADYENVILDLDGTLVDSAPGIEYALLKSIQSVSPEGIIQLPDVKSYIGPPLNELIKQILPGVSEDLLNQIMGHFRLIYDDVAWQRTLIYEHVIDVLSWLKEKGIVCFLITNKPFQPTHKIAIKFGLLEFFKDIVTPDIKYVIFQSKEIMVKYLIQKYSLNPGKTLMVGDTTSDGYAAQLCGIDFAAVGYGYGEVNQFNHIHSVAVIHRPDDICHILGGKLVHE